MNSYLHKKSEARKVFILLALTLFLSGCATIQKPYVEFYKDPDVNINTYTKFIIPSPARLSSSDNPLINKTINNIVKNQLINKGYILAEDFKNIEESDFFIIVSYTNNYKEHYVPPEQAYLPFPNYETTTYQGSAFIVGDVNAQISNSGKSTASKTTYLPITTGGYYEGFFYPCIYIKMYDTKKNFEYIKASKTLNAFQSNLSQAERETLFWYGSAIKSSNEADITKSALDLVASILNNFPVKNIQVKEKLGEAKKETNNYSITIPPGFEIVEPKETK